MSKPVRYCGWYYIDETWNLYVDGVLEKRHVDFLQVDVTPDGERFVARHYDRGGEIITTCTIDEDDIENELADEEPIGRPPHL